MVKGASPVVLVHGAWHGPWCWERVTPLLDAASVRWQALDLPTMRDDVDHPTDVHCDAATVRDALDALSEPAVVVAHSYGGMPTTEGAAGHPNIGHIVYLTAYMPDVGEDLIALSAKVPNEPRVNALRVDAEKRWMLDPDFVGPGFYNDCDAATVAWAIEHQRSMAPGAADRVRAAAWRDRPSTYVICLRDQAVLPELQRMMAKRASRVIEWDTSHSPFASRPELVANLLIDLARAEPSQT
jgi:pimeloyl-ACP methyl ester carboxylesterase